MSDNHQVDTTTNFGYQKVEQAQKQTLVDGVFDSVAKNYDLMNDLMSLSLHRLWKKAAIASCAVRPNSKVLDVAGGTGDIALALAKKIGREGQVVLSDINQSMLQVGLERMTERQIPGNVTCVQTNAEQLAFSDNTFDVVVISFGLRNVTRIDKALESMYTVLRPSGKVVILEFSKPIIPTLRRLYDFYSFSVIPNLGSVVARDRESYQYLVESIRRHPDQETLADMMADAGFERVEYFNLCGGIVALHVGRKI